MSTTPSATHAPELFDVPDGLRIKTPRAAMQALGDIFGKHEVESFGFVALNGLGEVRAIVRTGIGAQAIGPVIPREFFREALRHGATSAIAFRVVPGSDARPDQTDVRLCSRLRASGEALGVFLADYIILGAPGAAHSARAAQGWDKQ